VRVATLHPGSGCGRDTQQAPTREMFSDNSRSCFNSALVNSSGANKCRRRAELGRRWDLGLDVPFRKVGGPITLRLSDIGYGGPVILIRWPCRGWRDREVSYSSGFVCALTGALGIVDRVGVWSERVGDGDALLRFLNHV